jgi:hypothetical protein
MRGISLWIFLWFLRRNIMKAITEEKCKELRKKLVPLTDESGSQSARPDGNPQLFLRIADRKKWFYDTYPEGRILTDIQSIIGDRVYKYVVKASVYEDADKEKLPLATAHGEKRAMQGDKYSSLAGAESIAMGKALRNAGFILDDEIFEQDDIIEKPDPVAPASAPPRSTVSKNDGKTSKDGEVDITDLISEITNGEVTL